MNPHIRNMLELAKGCKSRIECARRYPKEYQELSRMNLLDLAFQHLPPKPNYTREALAKAAAQFETRSDWLREDPATFHAAHRRGIAQEIGPKSRRGHNLTGGRK